MLVQTINQQRQQQRSKYYQTYTLDEATAAQGDVYNQWLYTWVEPSEYVGKTVDVYQYTGTKDNKDYDIYLLMSGDKEIGGYYYEKGKDMSSATILDNSVTARIASDFQATWDKLFNIQK